MKPFPALSIMIGALDFGSVRFTRAAISPNCVDLYGSAKPGKRSFGRFSRPLLEVFFQTSFRYEPKVKSLAVAEIFRYCKGFRLSYSYFCLLDQKYKRGLVKALISGTVAFDGSERERWENVSLAEIFTISAGGDIDRQNSSPSCSASYPYPVYANALTNNGLYGYANYFKVKGDSITVSGRGEVGHAIARHCKYVPIVRLLSLVPKYGDDVDFFAYMINATSIYIESTGVPQLTSPQLGAVKVLRPPIREQKRLSSLLLKMDAKLENEEHLTFYLKKIRAFMLQQLFI